MTPRPRTGAPDVFLYFTSWFVDKNPKCRAGSFFLKIQQNRIVERINRLQQAGGGTFFVPHGVWKCPPLNFTSNTVVYLEAGATLKADTDSDWPLYAPLSIYGQGHDHPGPRLAPFIGGFFVDNLTIGGENGTIDGSGFYWYV